MKALTEKLSQFQGLVSAILALAMAVGLDRARLLRVLSNPLEWGVWEPTFLLAVVLIVGIFIARQSYAGASSLKAASALRLDPTDPRHLLGRRDDIGRVVGALPNRLIFLVGESGSGKTALLQAGVIPAPEVIREFVPVYVDLTDQDWDDGLLTLIRDRFRLALPEAERPGFVASDTASPADLLAAFDLYRQKLGRRPLPIFDQFDDYAAHHLAHLRDPEIAAWRSAEEVAAENPAMRLVRDGLARRVIVALFASRREDQDALEAVRMLPKPSILRLDRPPTGSAGSIIDAVTMAQSSGQVVVENPNATWPALKRRMATDLERAGQVLPQQLKLVLQGSRSLARLTVGAYERAGGLDGLEAASVRDAMAAAARNATLSIPMILHRVLIPLVDAERRPPERPGRAPWRSWPGPI